MLKTGEKLKNNEALRWLLSISKKQIYKLVILVVTNSVFSACLVAVAFLSKGLVDNAANGNRDEMIKYMVLISAVVVFRLILNSIYKALDENTRLKLEMTMKSGMVSAIIKKDYKKITSFHSGELMNRLTNDILIAVDGLVSITPNLVGLITKLSLAFISLVALEKRFAIIFAVGGVLVFITTRLFRKVMKKMHKDVQESEGKVRSFTQETFENLLVIKVFNVKEQINKKIEALMQNNYAARMKRIKLSIFASLGLGTVFNAGYYFTYFWCARGILLSMITFGTLTAILQLVNQIQVPISNLSGIIPRYYSLVASAERLIEVFHLEEELPPKKNIIDYNNIKGISFENISFSYSNETVLEDTGLYINKGEFVAVTGISGIGKSTLLKLLLGVLTPQNGRIIFKNESDKETAASSETRNLFAYVPQGNMLLSGTILENITFLSNNKTDDEIKKAIEISCVDMFLSELPDGLETVIGERGFGLSEGQIQRIAIARAVLYNAPILLLDEATSALDEETEKRMLKNLRTLQGKTCIIISHKRAAVEMCDNVIKIVNKKIVNINGEDGYEN